MLWHIRSEKTNKRRKNNDDPKISNKRKKVDKNFAIDRMEGIIRMCDPAVAHAECRLFGYNTMNTDSGKFNIGKRKNEDDACNPKRENQSMVGPQDEDDMDCSEDTRRGVDTQNTQNRD
ncbi:hypothetical protein QAD02_008783 [Eretmocerus hayati]|uniref:Uncharacterized protein n=1 Tax=Eretmocerus hayati TaxID=131215 RepID=A0ACC2N8U5_9HYME|nr:hypothetical protein QAD02_008783 [Eretmocerus hayati]